MRRRNLQSDKVTCSELPEGCTSINVEIEKEVDEHISNDDDDIDDDSGSDDNSEYDENLSERTKITVLACFIVYNTTLFIILLCLIVAAPSMYPKEND